MSDENATVVIKDIQAALKSSNDEAANKAACFVVVGGEYNGTVYDLPAGIHTVGRNPDNTIALDIKGISRRHFQADVSEDNKIIITDLGSSNGTFINENKITGPTKIEKSSIIKMGSVTLKFIPKGDPERLTYDKLHRDANTDGLTQCYNKIYRLANPELPESH